uniref:RecQ-mediated genome instability protein 1 n=1 Tax=Trichuris muris TaxID=70415 RepID=A0A5S6QEK1_TRIMR
MDLDQLLPVVMNQLAKHHIPFLTEWLKECLEYLHDEFNGSIPSGKDLFEMVYQQWLFCDLRDFGVASLPKKLPAKADEVVSGTYYVQINSILDVSHSLYSQYQRLVGSGIDIEESEGEIIPEANAKHLFVLELTDGVAVCRGIEYEFISELDYSIRPGAKAKIFGKTRRFGEYLLLTSENFCLLGGSCDSFEVESSPVNILKRKLENLKCQNTAGEPVPSNSLAKSETVTPSVPSPQLPSTFLSVPRGATDQESRSHSLSYSAVDPVPSVQENRGIEPLSETNHFYCGDFEDVFPEGGAEAFLSQDDAEAEPLLYEKHSVDIDEGPLEASQQLAVVDLAAGRKIIVESTVTNGIHVCFDSQLGSTSVRFLTDVLAEGAGEYLIRGVILTTIGKLDPNRGSHWSLVVKVNDGSTAMNMKIDGDLLTRLIGVTPQKAWAIKTGSIIDPIQRNLATAGLKKCGMFLRDFDGVLEVLFTEMDEIPVIRRLLTMPNLESII